jgi:hypothetical protein
MSLMNSIVMRAKVLTDKRHREFFLQRRITDLDRREQASTRVAKALPAMTGALSSQAQGLTDNLETNGYAMLDGAFPPHWTNELRSYFEVRECYDPYRTSTETFIAPRDAPKGAHVAFFRPPVIVKAPHIFDIVNQPHILQAVGKILGAKPTIGYIATWWSLPTGDGPPKQAENFHRDADDLRFIKLFFYLTDVDEESGPHVYVPGSHRQNKLTTIRRYTDEEVTQAFGNEKRFVGPAGTAFLENTFGFHRGFPPKSKPRLVLGVTYTLRPIPYGPANPVCQIGKDGVPAGLDPYINRVYCAPA